MKENWSKNGCWILLASVSAVLVLTVVRCRQILRHSTRLNSALELIGYGGLMAACVIAMGVLLLHHSGRNRQQQKKMEEIQRKNEMLDELNRKTQQLAHHQRLEIMGTLTSSIAHEFNNLLVPIMGYSMMVLEKLPEDQTQLYDDVLEIYNTSLKAKTLIQRLSDLSRKNSESVFRRLSPDDLVQKVLHVAKPAKPEAVEVRTALDCTGVVISGNEMQLSQMLLNLVLNAFHAMGDKGGVLTISTKPQEQGVIFTISDTGGGIAPEVIPYIFEPFFTTKEMGKGTGLGLAIVAQVVEDHKGDIDVESRLGMGTTFLVTIPFEHAKNAL